jgi:hypothetical protein
VSDRTRRAAGIGNVAGEDLHATTERRNGHHSRSSRGHHAADTGSTTFSLIVPRVEPPRADRAPIHTEAITAIHKGFILLTGQDQTYTVTALHGTAALGPWLVQRHA